MFNLRMKINFFVIFLLLFGVAIAKKSPNPESIIEKSYVKPQSGAERALLNKIGVNNKIKRLYYPDFQSASTVSSVIVEDFLNQYSNGLGINEDISDLRLISNVRSLGAEHFRYQQYHNGIPVFASQLLVNINDYGVITSVISDYKQNIDNLPLSPSISSESAKNAVIDYLKILSLRGEAETELTYFSDDENAYLCWKVLIPAEKPLGDWQIFVNAVSGEIVKTDNIMCFIDGSGLTFDPNPNVSEQSLAFRDSGDNNYPALLDARFDMVLENLDPASGGNYYLSGTFVNTQPTSNRASETDPNNFDYGRQSDYFEEVVIYYEINTCHNFYEALGFTNIMNFSIGVDVNGTTDDNSWYSPWNRQLTFGSGGVDDGEDGDVVVHEYGHATQHNQVPNWGQVHEGGAMGEGFGDLLTVSTFHPVSNGFDEARVFDWDANPLDNFWPGRRIDRNKHYPEDMTGSVHADGEIWSRCFWDMFNSIGFDTTLQLLLEGHFYLTGYADFEDAANAVVQADNNLYGGVHLLEIGQAFVDRGILLNMPIELDIYHQPLPDTENLNGPFEVTATISHTNTVDTVQLYFRYESSPDFTEILMTPSGNPDEFTANFPGPGYISEIFYYLRVVDDIGIESTLPSGAPTEYFVFVVGPDLLPPTISHDQIINFNGDDWPPNIIAEITDNLGIDSVYVEFRINGGAINYVQLTGNDTTDIWEGFLSGNANDGDFVEYFIAAVDSSAAGNMAFSPDTGYFGFFILENLEIEIFSNLNLPIPSSIAYDSIYIDNEVLINEVDIYVDITHTDIGDLYYRVISPDNAWVNLHNRTNGGIQNRVGWYDDDFTPYNPQDMTVFNDGQSQGYWTLIIADLGSGGSGTLNSWGVRIRGLGAPVSVDDEIVSLPTNLMLKQNYPNPFNPSTNIEFSLPSAGDVSIEIYDILGRIIAEPLNGFKQAGNHTVHWDGRNSNGVTVSSGIYFARLVTESDVKSIRMTLLK